MNDNAMNPRAFDIKNAMQQAALFKPVIGYVLILELNDRILG
jgi:hypothetical protein